MKPTTIQEFHDAQSPVDCEICDALRAVINDSLPDAESKIWHAHPVWFLDGNPIVGYSKLKGCNGGASAGDEMASAVVQSYKELIRRQDEQLAELQARLAHTQSQPDENAQHEVRL